MVTSVVEEQGVGVEKPELREYCTFLWNPVVDVESGGR